MGGVLPLSHLFQCRVLTFSLTIMVAFELLLSFNSDIEEKCAK